MEFWIVAGVVIGGAIVLGCMWGYIMYKFMDAAYEKLTEGRK